MADGVEMVHTNMKNANWRERLAWRIGYATARFMTRLAPSCEVSLSMSIHTPPPSEDDWFQSKEGQRSHKRALRDIRKGRVTSGGTSCHCQIDLVPGVTSHNPLCHLHPNNLMPELNPEALRSLEE